MTNTKDMTVGSYKKHIIAFALPIFLSNLFQQLYNSVDSLIVGKFLGTEALAAVSSSGNLIFLFTSFFMGTAMGAGVIISRYFGQKNYEGMSLAIHTDIAFGLAASLILTVGGVILTPYMLRWMDTDPNVLPNSITYFRNYFYGATGVIMYSIFNGILQAVGNSKRPLYYLLFSSVLNIILDLLFIGVFKWGVGGAGIATGISQLTSALLCLSFLMKKGTIYQVELKKIKFHAKSLKLIAYYGIPSGIQNSVIAIANVFVQKNINSFGGLAMAGCGTYSKIEGFAFLPITSFSLALSTFVGQNLGAKEYDRAKRGSRFGIICSISLAEIIGVVMFFAMPIFARAFSDDDGVISIASLQARTCCLFYFLLAYSHSIASVCRGAGKAIIPMSVMLIVWCVIRVIYIIIAMQICHDIRLLLVAYPITWFISSIIYFLYYHFSNWLYGFERVK